MSRTALEHELPPTKEAAMQELADLGQKYADPPPIRPHTGKRKKKPSLREKNAELRRQLAELKGAKPAHPQRQFHTDDVKIEQPASIEHNDEDRSQVVQADKGVMDADYLAELAMGEEPVTIEIHTSGGENPVREHQCQVNGKGAEVLVNGQWKEVTWLPVGIPLTVKRKYAEVLAGSKLTNVRTEILDRESDRPRNIVHRPTMGTCNFTVIHDANPKGTARFAEIRRRPF